MRALKGVRHVLGPGDGVDLLGAHPDFVEPGREPAGAGPEAKDQIGNLLLFSLGFVVRDVNSNCVCALVSVPVSTFQHCVRNVHDKIMDLVLSRSLLLLCQADGWEHFVRDPPL